MCAGAREAKRSKAEILAKLAHGPVLKKFKEWKATVFEEEDEHATDREVIVKRIDRLEDLMTHVADAVFDVKSKLATVVPDSDALEQGKHTLVINKTKPEVSPRSVASKVSEDKTTRKGLPVVDVEIQTSSTATAIQQQMPQLVAVSPSRRPYARDGYASFGQDDTALEPADGTGGGTVELASDAAKDTSGMQGRPVMADIVRGSVERAGSSERSQTREASLDASKARGQEQAQALKAKIAARSSMSRCACPSSTKMCKPGLTARARLGASLLLLRATRVRPADWVPA